MVVALVALSSHATSLCARGFTVVEEPILDGPRVDRLAQACSGRLHSLLAAIADIGYDPLEQSYTFAEVSHRQRKRWDMRPDFEEDIACDWVALCDAAVATATPIIREALGEGVVPRVDMTGAVISRPGCAAQSFHADATQSHFDAAAARPQHRLFTAFVPLVDVCEDGDGTQFWSGSHIGDELERARRGISGDGELQNAPLEAPGCPKGGMILFDYRVLHRGLPNTGPGRERPVAYAVLSTDGATDQANFEQQSLVDSSPLLVDHAPYWADE